MADRPPPSALSVVIGTALIAGVSGYMIGIASSLGFFPIPFAPKPARAQGRTSNYDDEEESDGTDIDEGTMDHAPNWGNGLEADRKDGLRNTAKPAAVEEKKEALGNPNEECKLVLVVRTDLGMTKGKIAAQASHATLACYKTFLRKDPKSPLLRRWEREGQAKVALQVKSEAELQLLQATALSLGLVAEVIQDAGRTQIAAGSHTVLGIGPGPKSLIDRVTGELKLL